MVKHVKKNFQNKNHPDLANPLNNFGLYYDNLNENQNALGQKVLL